MTRDLLWFRAGPTYWSALTGGISQKSLVQADIPANSTNLVDGAVPVDAHSRLRGTIEHLAVYEGTAVAKAVTVFVFSSGSTPSDTITSNHYIDHEPFAAADFFELSSAATQIQFQGKNDLGIPYFDKTGSKNFHLGVSTTSMGGLQLESLVIEIGFRPDPGGG
jgi:hypothetical protein